MIKGPYPTHKYVCEGDTLLDVLEEIEWWCHQHKEITVDQIVMDRIGTLDDSKYVAEIYI